ncbi:MAG: glucose-6-phosphate isomerase [Proteobacteria bacterium]|nr:glucose-6-phosphate isomerase [Pseudomonadota bacterium]
MLLLHWDKAINNETLKMGAFDISKRDQAIKRLESRRKSGELGFMDVSLSREKTAQIKETVSYIQKHGKDFIVLGIGGSSLGGKTMISALTNKFSNKGTKVTFIDNVDPDYFFELLNVLDLSSTVFNVISKSGSTAETMAQFLVIYKMLCDKLGKKEAVSRIILTTDPEKGALRPLVRSMGFNSFEVPQNIGGRFSVLTDVGLLPAAVAGIDIEGLVKGAQDIVKTGLNNNIDENSVLKYSLIKHNHYIKGRTCSVIMPYSTKLADFSAWYVQLWAESLGKKGLGQTPIPATGATDQHSQLQLFMEGPKDKFITFIGIEKTSTPVELPKFDVDVEAFSYLSGHTMHELIRAEMLSTEKALSENGVPSVRIEIPELDAYHLGALFMFFEMAVALTGEFLEINAFDQPGVELSKKYTYKMMGRKGY